MKKLLLPTPRKILRFAKMFSDENDRRMAAAYAYEQLYASTKDFRCVPDIALSVSKRKSSVKCLQCVDNNLVESDEVLFDNLQDEKIDSGCTTLLNALVESCWQHTIVVHVVSCGQKQNVHLSAYHALFQNLIEKIIFIIEPGAEVTIFDAPQQCEQHVIKYDMHIGERAQVEMVFTDNNNCSQIVSSLNIFQSAFSTFVLHAVVGQSAYNFFNTRSHLSDLGVTTEVNMYPIAENGVMTHLVNEQLHNASHTESKVKVHGAGLGSARIICYSVGHVAALVKKVSVHHQTRILALDETVKVFAYPYLAVASSDVQCTHAAAVGMVSPEQFWYAASRGLDKLSIKYISLKGFLQGSLCEESIVSEIVRNRCK